MKLEVSKVLIKMKEALSFSSFPDERESYCKLFWEKNINFVLLSLQARAYVT